MARLYLSQSLCMLSKLKGKGKTPVAAEPSTRSRGPAGLSGEMAPGQAAPAVPSEEAQSRDTKENHVWPTRLGPGRTEAVFGYAAASGGQGSQVKAKVNGVPGRC